MKIQLPCRKCIYEKLEKEGTPANKGVVFGDPSELCFQNIEINNDGLYEMECSRGHKTTTAMQNEKFEILFDMGLSALLDGYKQEAVSCVHASMERFHEWCITVFLVHNNINIEDFNKTWKYVEIQSERQLGAFYFLYLQTFKSIPERFNEKDMVKFRNDVIHKGIIPKYEKAYEYIEYVYNYIRRILIKVKQQFYDSIQKIADDRLKEYDGKIGIVSVPSCLGLSILGLSIGSELDDIPLESIITRLSWLKK